MAESTKIAGEPAPETREPPRTEAVEPQVTAPPSEPRSRRALNVQTISIAIIAAIMVLGVLYVAQLPFIALLVSILLSFMLAPIADLLMRLRLPRAVASLIAVVAFCAVMYGLVHYSYNSAVSFAREVPKYSGEIKRLTAHVRQSTEQITKTAENVLPASGSEEKPVKVTSGSWATDMLRENFGSVSEAVLMISFIPFLVYFMLTWQEHARKATVLLFRLEHRTTAYATMGQISLMIRSFIVGNVLVGLFIGTASMVVFGFLHLPYFYFVGYLSGFLSLVPYLGVILAVIPPLLGGIGKLHSGELLIVAGTVFALHLFALNVLYPKFLGSRLKLNPLGLTVALMFWGWLWGAMGLIMAVPITAALKIIFDHVEPLRAYGAWLGE